MKNNKISAFTILEITVSMIVAAICFGIAFTAYKIISKSYENFDQRNQEIALFIKIDEWLKRDFTEAQRIYLEDESIKLEKGNQVVSYFIQEDMMVRNQGDVRADTFRIQKIQVTPFFEEFSPEYQGELRIIDHLVVEGEFLNQEFKSIYRSCYSSYDLFSHPYLKN
jgi:competence protein ComGF